MGALAGFAVGGLSFGFSRALSRRVDLPETRRVLTISGVIQLVFFPVAGWFVAPLLFGE
jgi:hypothetical protein